MLVSGNTNDTNKGKGIAPIRELSTSYSRIIASFPDFALRETRASAQYVVFNIFTCYIIIGFKLLFISLRILTIYIASDDMACLAGMR